MNPSWLKEWEIYQSLREPPAAAGPGAATRQGQPCEVRRTVAGLGMTRGDEALVSALWRSIDLPGGSPDPMGKLNVALGSATATRIRAGQILHLSPELTDEVTEAVFVLVAEVRDGMTLLVAFSPLSLPAARDEFLTELDDEGLRVLSAWNAYWVPLALAARSWPVELGTEPLMEDLTRYRESVLADKGVPEVLAERVGPPLEHPDDPRWTYYTQEADKLIKVVRLVMGLDQ